MNDTSKLRLLSLKRLHVNNHVLGIVIALNLLVFAAAAAPTNLVINSDFEKGTDPWYGQKHDTGKSVRAPEMLALDTKDTPDNSCSMV